MAQKATEELDILVPQVFDDMRAAREAEFRGVSYNGPSQGEGELDILVPACCEGMRLTREADFKKALEVA